MASTTEPKGEIQEVSEDVSTETLKYKTWVLKVSIHCGACSKKVIKILKKIDGVYTTQVDYLQQKVTVIGNVEAETLIKTLTKKTTKHVELLWPDPKANSKDKKQSKPKDNEKQSDPAEISEEAKANHGGGGGGGGGDKKKGKEPVKDEVVEVQESGGGKKKFEVGSSSNSKGVEEGNVVKPQEGGGGGGEGKLKEAQTGSLPSQSPPAAAEKQSGGVESEAVGEKSGGGAGNRSGGGGGGKKKKGKGQNGNNNVNAAEGELVVNAPSTGSPPVQPGPQHQPQSHVQPNVQSQVPNVQRPIPVPASHCPPPQQQVYEHPYYPRQQQQYEHPYPRQQHYEHPYPRQQQQQQYEHPYPRQQHYEHPYPRQQQQYFTPVHAMNYNAAHPSISYGAARYAPQPVYSQSHTYAHWGLRNEVDPPAYDLDNLPPAPPSHPPQAYPPHPHYSSDSDTYAFFSDENPNGCRIM